MLKEIRLQLDRLRSKRDLSLVQERSDKANKRLKFYTKIVTKVLDAERCSVFIADPVEHKTWLKAGTGLKEHDIEVPDGDSIVSKVIKGGESIRVSNLEKQKGTHKEVDAETGFITRSILCVPVMSEQRDEVVGAFEALNKEKGREFNDDDEEMLKEIADHLRMDFDSVFLDQQFLRLSERMYVTARRIISFLIGGIAVLLLILLLVIFTYITVPALGG